MHNFIYYIKLASAALIAVLTKLFGGFDMIFQMLLAFMVIDYVTGVICAVCQKKLSSWVGFRGIAKKCGMLCVVAVAHLLGQGMGIAEIRSLVIGFYLANEGISILENAGRIGVPLPNRLLEILEQLKEESHADCIQSDKGNPNH